MGKYFDSVNDVPYDIDMTNWIFDECRGGAVVGTKWWGSVSGAFLGEKINK